VGKNTARAEASRKAAEMRAAAARKDRQHKQMITAAVAVVIVVIAVAIGIVVARQPKSEPAAAPSASTALTKLTSLPVTTLEKAPKPTAQQMPAKIAGAPALTGADGKPKILYIGAEYCPFCAMERWALIGALSQFGTFEGLAPSTSSSTDVHPDTPTWSFAKSTYKSDYIDFEAIETRDRQGNPLQPLEGENLAIFQKYNPGGGIPWVSFGGTHQVQAATVDTTVFEGKTYDQLIAGILDPSSTIGKGIDPSITAMTAQVCAMTDNKPQNVCSSPGVTAAASLVQR
jgi:thiol-disulfide isomerase/thioredoxin